jgi:hypothetical protein
VWEGSGIEVLESQRMKTELMGESDSETEAKIYFLDMVSVCSPR